MFLLFVVCLIRELLADIVKIKMEHYDMSKVRSLSAEEYLKAFFEMELKPIWPQGWIQTRFDLHSCYVCVTEDDNITYFVFAIWYLVICFLKCVLCK